MSPDDIADRYGVDVDDVEHELALVNTQTCPVCGWWSHTWHPDGVCADDQVEWDDADDNVEYDADPDYRPGYRV